jgi:phosphoenolpyruvate carboxylase
VVTALSSFKYTWENKEIQALISIVGNKSMEIKRETLYQQIIIIVKKRFSCFELF